MSGSLPLLTLLVLAPGVAELLSGYKPPLLFINPIVFVYLSLYYGGAAVLARELALRWKKGWPSVLALGATFGVIQEGLGTKVFFDPGRTELGPLVNYGTSGGVHWPFVVQLLVYHAVYSVGIPVLLANLIFRSRSHQTWARDRFLVFCAVCVVVATGIAFFSISPAYRPPVGPYAIACGGAVLGCVIARFLPSTLPTRRVSPTPRSRWWWTIGCTSAVAFFFSGMVLPGLGVPPILTTIALAGVPVIVVSLVVSRMPAGSSLAAPEQLALAAGALTPLILFAPLHELRGSLGMSIVGVLATVLLYALWRRCTRSPFGSFADATPRAASAS